MTERHDVTDLGFHLPAPAGTRRATIAISLGIGMAAAFAIGYARHVRGSASEHPSADAASAGRPRIEIITPSIVSGGTTLALPGIVRALEQTKICPRVSGSVRSWQVDIGDKVTAGQVLAEIDAPDLVTQLAQARAHLASARAAVERLLAQHRYSRDTASRYASLAEQDLIAQSQVEQVQSQASSDDANVVAAKGDVAAAESSVQRMVEAVAFSHVTAPFAGTITSRNIERGMLVSESPCTELYTLAAIDPVRILIDTPQPEATNLASGTEAEIAVRNYPGRTFPGKVTRSAGALDPELHTMTTEVRVANSDGALMPGMYVQVILKVKSHRALEIPATAAYNDARGLRVATLDASGRVHFVTIAIERDTGSTLQIATGLTGDERIVKIARPGIHEGDVLELSEPSHGATRK
jgi:membrane fusion protein (multidrug efflux system)